MIHKDKIEGKSIGDCEENYENITISTRNCLGVLKQEMCVCLIFCFILDGGRKRKIELHELHELHLLLIIITWSYDSLGAVVGQPVEK